MSITTLRIATRKSQLALAQVDIVRKKLKILYPHLETQIIGITTSGDQQLDTSLAKIGGKGLFIKELEQALLDHRADIAVHSMKDVPMLLHDDLMIASILKREDPRDAFISTQFKHIAELPEKAIVGTSSLRREYLLKSVRPDLTIQFLRGNINTRLRKLKEENYDAIILAAAGLIRLNLSNEIQTYFDPHTYIPAAGQGAIGIECRKEPKIQKLLAPLADKTTTTCLLAERAVSRYLNADCHTPLGAFAEIENGQLTLQAVLANADTGKLTYAKASKDTKNTEELGVLVAKNLTNRK